MAGSKAGGKRIEQQTEILVAEMPTGREIGFSLVFDRDQLLAGAEQLGILGLQKARLEGRLRPKGRKDWVLEATIGATVTQACVVTLTPVRTRVDQEFTRTFVTNWIEPDADTVVEMDEDQAESEPLGERIHLMDLALEAISLAMPDYPRSGDVALENAVFTEPGVDPMTDDDAKPFAALAALKEKMDK